MTIFDNIFSCSSVDKKEDECNRHIDILNSKYDDNSARIGNLENKIDILENKFHNDINRIEDKITLRFDILSSKIDNLILFLRK